MTDSSSPLALTPAKLEALINPDEVMPWHQLEDEPDDAFEAFFFYRSLVGKRSCDKAFKQMLRVRNPGRLAAYKGRAAIPKDWGFWQTSFYWDSRAKAWDDHVRRSLMVAEADYLEEMLNRHRDSLIDLQKRGMAYIRENGFETSAAALRAVHHSIQMERDSAGLPDVSHLLGMDKDQLAARYQVVVQQLTMNVNAPNNNGE